MAFQTVFSWRLAWRYLRGKRGANVVPILSRISMFALAVGSCAMIVLFSIFNGFEDLVKDLYKAFYPEVKITAARGKFFEVSPAQMKHIGAVQGVSAVTRVIEDNVLLTANDEQQVATLKGVERNFTEVNDIKPFMFQGVPEVQSLPVPTAVVGLQSANRLGIQLNNVFSRVSVFYPNVTAGNFALHPQDAFQNLQLKPAGVFRIQDEFDGKFILAPIERVQQLFLQPGKYSSIELALQPGASGTAVQRTLKSILGSGFVVETRYEQNKTLYMVMASEKWAVYGILVLVLLIASFNMVGALTMLVLEKQKDIAILKVMGVQRPTLRIAFLMEGMLWAVIGGLSGILLGFLFCLGQQHFHWIRLKGAFIIEAYPVAMQLADFVVVLLTVVLVGLAASWYPAFRAVKSEDISLRAD